MNIFHTRSDHASTKLQNDADTAHTRSSQNDMIINATKTKELRIEFSKSRVAFNQLYIGNSSIDNSGSNYQLRPQMEPNSW